MKFSIVIPCQDRLELLKQAIYTVLQQAWENWELLIFDNHSKCDISGYLKSLNDKRIHYKRADSLLSVTESWNQAIDMATGDYTIFIGDDDGLTPGYFSKISALIEQFNYPDILYSSLYQFIYPGVAPSDMGGLVTELKNGFFFVKKEKPFLLSFQEALKAVKGSLNFRRNFTYNIQAFVFNSSFLETLRKEGCIFHSPFPDYYIANVAFSKSRSTVIIPQAMPIVGVSKASVGYTLFNNLEEEFIRILNVEFSKDPFYQKILTYLLPGPIYNSFYALTMEYVAKYCHPSFKGKVNNKRYRHLQIYKTLEEHILQNKRLDVLGCWKHLSFREKIWTRCLFLYLKLANRSFYTSKIFRHFLAMKLGPYSFRQIVRLCNENDYTKLTEVFDALNSEILK